MKQTRSMIITMVLVQKRCVAWLLTVTVLTEQETGCLMWIQTPPPARPQGTNLTSWLSAMRLSLIPLFFLVVQPDGQACSAVLRHALDKKSLSQQWV